MSAYPTAALASLAAVLFAAPVSAHVTLGTAQASIDARYQTTLRVPHGCKGSPTVALRVRLPEGVIGVKPQPKPGWQLETIKGDYAQTHTLRGAQVSSGVKEIIWSGGRLPDEHYDEFAFVGYLSGSLEPNTTLYLPVVQECEQGVARWIDVPDPKAQPAHDHSGSPAPGLKLLPKRH